MIEELPDGWLPHDGGPCPVDPDVVIYPFYRGESDPVARFLAMCTLPADGRNVQSSVLYELFAAWCKAAGEKEWSTKGFPKAMMDKGMRKKQSNGIWWLDIATTKTAGDFIDVNGRVLIVEDELGGLAGDDDHDLPDWAR